MVTVTNNEDSSSDRLIAQRALWKGTTEAFAARVGRASIRNDRLAEKSSAQCEKMVPSHTDFSGTAKRPRPSCRVQQFVAHAPDAQHSVNASLESSGWEQYTKGFGSRILEKYGFKGRLGATAQGISHPLEALPAIGRYGLGARNVDCDVDEHDRVANGLEDTIATFQGREASRLARVSLKSIYRKRRHDALDDRDGIESSNAAVDIYVARRKDPVDLSTSDVTNGCSVGAEFPPQYKEDGVTLNADDCFDECEEEDGDFDSGRRGILVDFDSLVRDSYGRRIRAFAAAVQGFDGIPRNFDFVPLLECDGRDLGDENAVRMILGSNNPQVTDEQCDALLNLVDDAFDVLDAPKSDEALVAALKATSQEVQIGVLHRGSKRRLNSELKRMNLSTLFNSRKIVLHFSDTSPYTRSWEELLCRLGVTARQSLFVVRDSNMSPISSFGMAGRILGARVMVHVDVPDDKTVDSVQLARHFDADRVSTSNTILHQVSLLNILKDQAPVPRRRRVLSRYGVEGLWYGARVEYQCRLKGRSKDKLLVRYYEWDNLEWVDPADTLPLTRRDYLILAAHKFCGLLEPNLDAL